MNKMSDKTPYSTRPAAERAREAACFRAILSDAVRPELVLETFGGIGDTTAVLEELFPAADTVVTELDPATALMYGERHRGRVVHNQDCLLFDWVGAVPDSASTVGIVLDYNLLTLKRLRDPHSFVRQVLEAVPVERASWITVTDAAISKFHLNKATYGVTDWDSYIAALEVELSELLSARGGRWALGDWDNHSREAYLRMDRKD